MMTTKTGSSAWFAESGTRLDASYHLSDGRMAKVQAEKCPMGTKSLGEVTLKIFNGPRFKRFYVEDAQLGIPFMGSSDMLKSDFSALKFISKKLSRNVADLWVEKSWTLISCSGTIGNTVYTNDDFDGKTASQHIMRVVANRKEILPGYLHAFLSSKYGYALLTQGTYGAVIQHIEPHHIAGLPIPILPDDEQRAIHEAVETAARLRVEANGLLRAAEQEFIERLNLDPATYRRLTAPAERDTAAEFVVSSEALSARTLRARNYSKRLCEIVAVLSAGRHQALVEVLKREPFQTGRFRRLESTSKTAVELFSQSDIFALKPRGQMISPRTVPFQDKVIVEKGSILIAGTGTLGENEIFGRAKFVWGYLENKLATQDITRIEPDEQLIDAGYLFVVLNSKLWFRIFRSSVFGTNLLRFIVPMLNEMPVPRFDRDDEEALGLKVKTAYEKMTEANALETTAIARVEAVVGSW